MKFKSTLLIASISLITANAFAVADETSVQIDAYALSANTPSCNASILVNDNAESHTIKNGDCETVKGPSYMIDPQSLEQGPITLKLYNADSKTLKQYTDSIPATAYSNIVAELVAGGYQHQSLTVSYPYQNGSVHCSQPGEILDIFTTAHGELIELCYAGYNN